MKTNSELSQLPNEILLKILSFFPLCDLIKTVSILSKKFHALTKDRSLKLSITLHNKSTNLATPPELLIHRSHQIERFDLFFTPPEELEIHLVDGHKSHQYIFKIESFISNLVYYTPLSQNYFSDLFKNQLGMKQLVLQLKDNTSLNEALQHIYCPFPLRNGDIAIVCLLKGISKCQALEHLDLQLKALSNTELQEVASLPNLKSLLIHLSPEISPSRFKLGLTQSKWHNLVILSIYFYHAYDSCLDVIWDKCPSLVNLSLRSMYNLISVQGISKFLSESPKLESLKIQDFANPVFEKISPFFKDWKHLEGWCYRHLYINKYVIFRRTESVEDRYRDRNICG